MRLHLKLSLLILLTTLLAILCFAIASTFLLKNSLTKDYFNFLVSIRSAKAMSVERYFRDLEHTVLTLSESESLRNRSLALMATYRDESLSAQQTTIDPKMAQQESMIVAENQQYLQKNYAKHLDSKTSIDSFMPDSAYHQGLFNTYVVKRQTQKPANDNRCQYCAKLALLEESVSSVFTRYPFYDFFVIDAASARVLYTRSKEIDYLTNLQSGPLRNSHLAQIFRDVIAEKKDKKVYFQDFKNYLPSHLKPAAFLATPIFVDNRLTSVMVFQLSIDEINNVMTSNKKWESVGLGKTGETYLIAGDETFRNDSRSFLEDPETFIAQLADDGYVEAEINRLKEYRTSILIQRNNTRSAKEAIVGNNGVDLIKDYRGLRVLSAYQPVKVFDYTWALIAEMDESEAFASLDRLYLTLGLMTLIFSISGVFVSSAMAQTFLKPIKQLLTSIADVAGGNYSKKIMQKKVTHDELSIMVNAFNGMIEKIEEKANKLLLAKDENEKLLLNILPQTIADRLKSGEIKIVDHYNEASILFADIVGFTKLSEQIPPYKIVEILNNLFTEFDRISNNHGVEKIKTIGDCYMAVYGLPKPATDNISEVIADLALDMINTIQKFNIKYRMSLSIRIGINTGPVVAGIIGESKYIYDLWGDAVNVASRMESSGLPNQIQVTETMKNELAEHYEFTERGMVEVKGKGSIKTYILLGKKPFSLAQDTTTPQ